MEIDLEKKYELSYERNKILIFLWPIFSAILFFAMISIHSGVTNSEYEVYVLYVLYADLFALILAIACQFLAKSYYKNGKTKSAISILSIPIFYLILFIIFYSLLMN